MMKFQILIWLISVFCLEREATIARKFVLQNEMSEYCRRRVISSIFLGRHVAQSSAEVMHFSRLDLPYSCSISVRTESGSNIILVILSKTDKSIAESCTEGHDQLLVYEMGETFGGYWAALPQSVFQPDSQNRSTFYTLKTTERLSETIGVVMDDYKTIMQAQEIVSLTTPEDKTDRDYVVMEVPLVNVSGNIELAETEATTSDENELFDLIYDVTPKNGVLYDTSMMPLVQFSIWKQKGQTQGLESLERRYGLEYNVDGFTPDYRLMRRTKYDYKRIFSNSRYRPTKRFKFKKKNKHLFAVNNWTSRIHPHSGYITELITRPMLRNKELLDFTTFKSTDSYQLEIENYLNLLNVNNLTTSRENTDDELALLKKISNMKHNASVYLQSNLSKYKDAYSVEKKDVESKITNKNYSSRKYLSTALSVSHPHYTTKSTYISDLKKGMSSTKVAIKINKATLSTSKKNPQEFTAHAMLPSVINHQERLGVHSASALQSRMENVKGAIAETRRKSESGSLVDHESWENIVQVAPAMADFLNVTSALTLDNTTVVLKEVTKHTSSVSAENKISRKKRYIQALSVDEHQPRQLTTRDDAPAPELTTDQFDSHHLAEVVELQDDEIQGRVALHYFKNYVGPTIFNMCDYSEAKVRQVYLFNSSRIIIAINNFTMDRITIMLTETRVARATGCPAAHLECQVSGVRVCVHNMNACDGLPNCGAYDVYDEDRRLCGTSVGFHYTVCLAACTFLVVLLTLLYSIHYWLKRCVPKVSQAFFVYSDKSENILFLDSIMRSPNDYDGASRLVYHSSFFDDEDLSTESAKDNDRKVLNIIRRCLRFVCCRKTRRHSSDAKSQQDTPSSVNIDPTRKFSFTETELGKIGTVMTRNVSIQTGDSLERGRFVKPEKLQSKDSSISDKKKTIQLQQNDRELTALRRIRAISATLQSGSKNFAVEKLEQNAKQYPEDEVELRSTLYDREGKKNKLSRQVLERAKYEIHSESPEQKRTKHLRFEEGAIAIEPSAVDLNDDEDNIDRQRSIPLNTDKLANRDLDAVEDNEEPSTSGRDFRRFWGKGKKKKAQLPLR